MSVEPRPCYICGDVFNDKMKLGMHIVRCYEVALQNGRTDVAAPDAVVDEGYTKVVMKDPRAAFADMKRAIKSGATHDTTRRKVSAEMKVELEKLRKLREDEEGRVRAREEKLSGGGEPSEKTLVAQEMKAELALMKKMREGEEEKARKREKEMATRVENIAKVQVVAVKKEAPVVPRRVTVQSPKFEAPARVPPPPLSPPPPPPLSQGAKDPKWTEFMVTYPRPVIDEKPMSKDDRERHQANRNMRDEEAAFRRALEEEKNGGVRPPSASGAPRPTSGARRPPSQERRPPSQERRPPPARQPSQERKPPTEAPKLLFCTHCGRPFPPERLPLHTSICKRVAEKKASGNM